MERDKQPMAYEAMVAPPPAELASAADIADFGRSVQRRFNEWWQRNANSDFGASIEVYFGQTTRHEMLERTVWHSTQHVRQVASLLEQAGITPDKPLRSEHLEGLPLTERVWDDG